MHKVQQRKNLLSGLFFCLVLVGAFGAVWYAAWYAKSVPVGQAAPPEWLDCQPLCTGENIFTLQLMLRAHNLRSPVNGLFDAATVGALKTFQATSHLVVSGTIDASTWPVLLASVKQGDRGLAIVALQRQLAVHGEQLIPDGEFDLATLKAVKSYQHAHKLTVDGVGGLTTWASLLNVPASVSIAPPPPSAAGPTFWGVDTAPPLTLAALARIIHTFGKPSFVGKYLDGTNFIALSVAEARMLHAQGMRILLLEADFGKDTGYRNGAYRARQALLKAQVLHVPEGVAIFADLEPGSKVDVNWLVAWYNVISHAGYVPGYYGNPYPGHNFNSPFCAAVTRQPHLASQALLDIYEPMQVRTSARQRPLFAPATLYCGKSPTGNVLVWQYGLARGDSKVNVDVDEVKAAVPLW